MHLFSVQGLNKFNFMAPDFWGRKFTWRVGPRFGKKHFFKIVKSLVTVLLKMALFIRIYHLFIKNPLILSLLKIVTLKFIMYILTTLIQNCMSSENRFFTTQTFLNLKFNEHFLRNKRYRDTEKHVFVQISRL